MGAVKLDWISPLVVLALATSGLVTAEAPAEAVAERQSAIYSRPNYFQISGTCAAEMSPDQAVIVGGVSSAALQPGDAINQLEKELGLMRSYLSEMHGELQMMERVRTLKNPQPGREDSDPPFQVVQRLQVKLPADAPVDAILQKLIELGLDRFGDNVLNNYNRREAVIRFRMTDFDARLHDFQQRCTVDAWKQWCSTASANEKCGSPAIPPELDLQVFSVRSKELLMRADGATAAWQWSVTPAQRLPEPPDLLGNVTVHLEGNIVLTYHREEANP
jgi:hypothetical protein